MATQIGGAIVAMHHEVNPSLITLMVDVGVIVSFLTLPLWSLALTTT